MSSNSSLSGRMISFKAITFLLLKNTIFGLRVEVRVGIRILELVKG